MSSFIIRSATAADLPTMARISHFAFRQNPWARAMYPIEDEKGNIARYMMRLTSAIKDPENVYYVATVNDTAASPPPSAAAPGGSADVAAENSPGGRGGAEGERIVGYAKWTVHSTARPESDWRIPFTPIPVPDGGRQDVADLAGSELHALRQRVIGGAAHVLLHFLVVDPAFQRRGIGAALMRWGLDRADSLRVPAILEATREGYELYRRMGFLDIDRMEIPTARWGVDEDILIIGMKRPVPEAAS